MKARIPLFTPYRARAGQPTASVPGRGVPGLSPGAGVADTDRPGWAESA